MVPVVVKMPIATMPNESMGGSSSSSSDASTSSDASNNDASSRVLVDHRVACMLVVRIISTLG